MALSPATQGSGASPVVFDNDSPREPGRVRCGKAWLSLADIPRLLPAGSSPPVSKARSLCLHNWAPLGFSSNWNQEGTLPISLSLNLSLPTSLTLRYFPSTDLKGE